MVGARKLLLVAPLHKGCRERQAFNGSDLHTGEYELPTSSREAGW